MGIMNFVEFSDPYDCTTYIKPDTVCAIFEGLNNDGSTVVNVCLDSGAIILVKGNIKEVMEKLRNERVRETAA